MVYKSVLTSLVWSLAWFAVGQAHAQVDVTRRGDPVQGVPNDGDWPGNEAPPLAIDDSVYTKYLHFKGGFDPNSGPTGLRVTPRLP